MVMSVYDKMFDRIIEKALNILFEKGANIYTFALYYDHENHAVSVFADTKSNSKSSCKKSNEFAREQFKKCIFEKNLVSAANWSKVPERSFSLGDFKFGSLGWESFKTPNNSAPFYIAMVEAIFRHSDKIASLTGSPEELIFCCSNQDWEVGFSWFYQ